MQASKLSIIIPVYNEINTLESIIDQVMGVQLDLEKEIIIVDDASTDGTTEWLKAKFPSSDDIPVKIFS